jgi:lipid II:glycine glycyltransferase (peptidoglycan interpeptide bridge formation enzyme)
MDIRQIYDQKTWDNFVQAEPDYTFLNSWAWGDFNEASGSKIWRLGMFEEGALQGAALVILVAARRGRFLFVPHGPIISQKSKVKSGKIEDFVAGAPERVRAGDGQNAGKDSFPAPSAARDERSEREPRVENERVNFNLKVKTFTDHLKSIAREEHCSFIRISPLLLKTPENEKLFTAEGFRLAPIHMHAETTWILDTTVSEEKLLADMRKTTRYLVRRGEKEGVEVVSANTPDLLREFYSLYTRTAGRQHFVPFSFDYIAKEAAAFGERDARVYLAKQGGNTLAGALIIFYGDRAFYHHGASLHHPTASYLLQWRVIQESRARGVKEYNFWGVDFRPLHPWAGVTLFKTGFGGGAREYAPAQDLTLRFSYWVSFGIETLRRIRRRY